MNIKVFCYSSIWMITYLIILSFIPYPFNLFLIIMITASFLGDAYSHIGTLENKINDNNKK